MFYRNLALNIPSRYKLLHQWNPGLTLVDVFVKRPQLLLDLKRADPESVITFPANTSIQHVWSSTLWLYLLLVVVANAGKHLI